MANFHAMARSGTLMTFVVGSHWLRGCMVNRLCRANVYLIRRRCTLLCVITHVYALSHSFVELDHAHLLDRLSPSPQIIRYHKFEGEVPRGFGTLPRNLIEQAISSRYVALLSSEALLGLVAYINLSHLRHISNAASQ